MSEISESAMQTFVYNILIPIQMENTMQALFATAITTPTSSASIDFERQDSMHIGGGNPIRCVFNLDDVQYHQDAARSCSSMCSTASTVVSALSSIETPISFPPAAPVLSFDLTAGVAHRLYEKEGEQSACRNSIETSRVFKHCRENRVHPYEKLSKRHRAQDHSNFNKFPLASETISAKPNCEEFSLGSGNPWEL